MKKVILMVIIILIVVILGIGIYYMQNISNSENTSNISNNKETNSSEVNNSTNNKKRKRGFKMSKKIIALIVVMVLIAIIGGVAYFMSQNSNESQSGDNTNQEGLAEQHRVTTNNTQIAEENNESNSEETTTSQNSRILVVYFSAQGHTDTVAHKIAENLGADIFEIEPVDEYSSDDLNWTDNNSRVSREYADESLRNVELQSTTVENWEQYDTVLIGYPIWWGIAAWPVDTFVKTNDFSGKTVIPFCTSSSSGLGQSGELLAEEANSGNWLEGQRFRSNPSDADINEWTYSLQ